MPADLGRAAPLLVAAALAAAGGARADGELRVGATPAAIVLGRDTGVDLRIDAPADAADLSVSTNAGRIEGLERRADGAWVARFVPPAERQPRVAIVSALARVPGGLLDGWTAIPLHGQARARVRARPGAAISLRIGGRVFGPVTADDEGRAAIPVVVPPGVREGYHGFRPVDLGVPETTLLHAVADRAAVPADALSEVRFRAYVVAPHGAARRGDVPAVEASRGTVSAVVDGPGRLVGTWRLPPGPAGEARLVVSLPGAPASRAVLRVEARAGAPAAVAIAFDRAAVTAGAGGDVGVTVRVLDAAGNPTAGEVELEAEGGALSAAAPQGAGVHAASLAVSPRFGGRAVATVTARVRGTPVHATSSLPLRPGAPAVARLEENVVVADGEERAIRVAILDRWDNPVAARPAIAFARGELVDVAPAGEGVYVVRWRPPAVVERTPVDVEADVDGARVKGGLLLVPPRRGPSFSVAGGLLASSGHAAPRVAMTAEQVLPWREPRLALRLEGGWASWSEGGAGRTLTTVLLGPVWRRERPRWEGWAAAGAGVALGATRPSSGRGDGAIAPAAWLTAGAGVRRAWGVPFVEAGILAAGEAVPGLGSIGAVTLSVGVRLESGERRGGGARTGGDRLVRGRSVIHGDDPDRR